MNTHATNADLLRWQRRAHTALGVILTAAADTDLPAITWTLPPVGTLIGDIDSLTRSPDAQRDAFTAWTLWLDARLDDERTGPDGVVDLYARFTWRDDWVRGAIRTRIYPPLADVEAFLQNGEPS